MKIFCFIYYYDFTSEGDTSFICKLKKQKPTVKTNMFQFWRKLSDYKYLSIKEV